MTIEIWQHKTSGARYVVTLNSQAVLTMAAGPLHESAIMSALDGYDGDPAVALDIATHMDDYEPILSREF